MARKKKKSVFLMVFRLIGLFVGGLAVAVFVALSSVNLETLRGNILGVMRDATGLDVEIDGNISWVFSLRPKIELNNVRVKNASWAKNKYAFDAERINVTLNLVSLLRNRPTIQNVSVNDAKVFIEKNDAGKKSIDIVSESNDVAKTDEENREKSKPQPKFPIKVTGFAAVEIHNLDVDVYGEKYVIPNFHARYIKRDGKREYSGWLKSGLKVFPFIVSMSEYNAERKVYPVSVAFTTGGTPLIANVALEGKSLMPIDFVIRGDVPDFASFGNAIGRVWPDLPPMMVNIAGGLDTKKIVLRKSSIAIRGTNIDFSGEYNWAKSVPNVVFNVNAGDVVLYKMFPTMYPGGTWKHPKRELNAFKDIPLFGDELSHINLKSNIKIKSLGIYRELVINDMDINLTSELGHGRLDIGLIFADGKFKIASDFDVDVDGRIYAHAAISAENMRIGKIMEEVRINNVISELPVNISGYVVANGRDLSEFMKTMTGPVLIKSSGKGYMKSDLVAYIYGKDALTSLGDGVKDLFSSDKKNEKIKITCATVNVKLRNGVAETQNGVAIQTEAINARLAGSVDLGHEKINLALTTVPVRGIKLSLTGNVVNSLEITGNLAEPDVKVNGLSVVGKVASATGLGLLLAPFTGGISVVAGAGIGLVAGDLLENWLADDEPCKTAYKDGAPKHRGDPEWLSEPIPELMNTVFKNNSVVEDDGE